MDIDKVVNQKKKKSLPNIRFLDIICIPLINAFFVYFSHLCLSFSLCLSLSLSFPPSFPFSLHLFFSFSLQLPSR